MNSAWWTRYLPEVLREWLKGRQQLQATISNTGWLMVDKIMRMLIGITVGAWIARYLGPVQFGELAYVISFIAFFQVIPDLQADGIIVRDIAQGRGTPAAVLGTALWLRLLFGAVSWFLAALLMLLLHPDDPRLFELTLIIGATMVFQPAEVVDHWFQSQSQSKRTVLAKLVAYLCSNSVKIILLLNEAPLVAFAWVTCLETATFALGLAIAYRRFPTESRWTITLSQTKALLHQCWPFIASALMITTYMRVDQIMLKEMLGERELGLFAAAQPLSHAWNVIPGTLVTSLAPFVARKMSQDEESYRETLVKIFRFFAIVALLGALLTAAIAPWLIKLLYGAQYQVSAAILSVNVFANVFIFQGTAQTLWIINNNVRAVNVFGTLCAAVVGVVSNFFFIRIFGVMGAVYATLLAQCTSVVVIPCLFRKDLRLLYLRAFTPYGSVD